MKIIKEIFARTFALYALIVFIVTMFIVVIPICLTFLIREPLGTEIFRIISNIWMRVWLTLIGCPLYVDGRKHFKKGEVYVVCCNHNSLMDIPLTTPFIPGANKTIAKTSFTKAPFFGWIYRRGSILVDRNSNASRAKSFEQMKETLDQGIHMCIYPEGTRNKTSEPLKSFYDGAFKLAIEKQKAILPCIILHTKKVLPASKIFYMLPHRLEMHFLPQVNIENKTAKELKDEVYKIMEAYIITQLQKTSS